MDEHPSDLHVSDESSRLDFGLMEYGCKHYRRRCKIRAPCCDEVFFCRHCHNESVADRHELRRHDVKKVICLICDEEQPPSQICTNCGVKMGNYFCGICNFYDDDTDKAQYHCDDCGICRVGGQKNFFHCQKCGACYSIELRDKHTCIEDSMRQHCPVCYEYLFDSLLGTRVLNCGHTMHEGCLDAMFHHRQYACPMCLKSMFDMSQYWRKLDEEVAATTMPDDYLNCKQVIKPYDRAFCEDILPNFTKEVWILCNDCNVTSEVVFHIVGQKCQRCFSYNTRTVAAPAVRQC